MLMQSKISLLNLLPPDVVKARLLFKSTVLDKSRKVGLLVAINYDTSKRRGSIHSEHQGLETNNSHLLCLLSSQEAPGNVCSWKWNIRLNASWWDPAR